RPPCTLPHVPRATPSLLSPYTTLFRSLRARRTILVRHPLQDAVVDQPGQALVEDVPGDAESGLEIVEPGHAEERVPHDEQTPPLDRKSTRLNSSHRTSSYAVFCRKKRSTGYSCKQLHRLRLQKCRSCI